MADQGALQDHFRGSVAALEAVLRSLLPAASAAVDAVVAALRRGGKVILFGNGGSAAQAQHIAAELTGRYLVERAALAAVALTTDTSALTAIGNDYGFERVFARQVEALARSGDVAVALSTSGRSANVLQAVDAARRRGVFSIGLSGGDGGELARRVDLALVVPSTSTPHIQEAHLALLHAIAGAVEREMAGK
jgi:D-sedoheptulose 7-phosphate isomerase